MATNNMKDTLKKYFYSGVGLASHAADAVQKSVQELSKKGKMNEADGKKIVTDMIKKVEARRPEIEAKYNAAVHTIVTATSSEMGKLQKKIQQLEKQLLVHRNGKSSNGAAKAKPKAKAAAKRKTARKPAAKKAAKPAAQA